MGPMVPENILCWQKEKREGRKREKERKGKKERKEGKGKKEKKKRKDRKRKKRVTASISSHFVQGQILGVGGAPKIISERTLIA
jgi:F0F1-type ATP synthase assembly protein I